MNSPRDQLADILYKQGAYCGNCDYESRCQECDMVLESYADAVLAAGFRPPGRVIETAEEMESVAPETVVQSAAGTIACRHYSGNGVIFGSENPFNWPALQLPVTVLREPGEGESDA